ncbi:toxin TcdB middle/N-terminal domain-containing protein, partial [Pseudovibrio denitrificans]|uniref:toxin TcdB middle/N-terminal domain-containing protein n=1 Tax=Pseudovibrio denitrificans TaxID=258256 RepID=UPI0035712BAD
MASRWKKNSSTSTYFRLYLNEGNGSFSYLAGSGSHTINGSATAYVGDMDRDGIAEIIERESNALNVYGDKRYYLVTDLPDVMISATDPSGVEQTISYSLYKGEVDNWFPYPRRIVSSVTTNDGRGSLSTTHYSYSGGKWDYERSLFLGFEKIITTLPKLAGETNALTIETFYRQDVSSVGKIAQQIWKDGDGTILRKQVQEYAVQNDNEPYTSLNTASLTYSYDEGVER